ncbi:unnamed protein product [Candida verbasci]|uniref:DNA repair protein rad9 n=1 Tax=Candida verbasci TaxID=1227364 RepID=A0A9W4TWA0_9ASCO|nr:unnamed protein product [Candida verbasci]
MFTAKIDNKKHKLIWSKSITSLSLISEAITFHITHDKLSLSALNSSKTSHGEIIFKKSFFSEYSINFNNIISEGFHNDSYSFIINSKHLATLFKNLESHLDYIILKCNWSVTVPSNHKYKLFIEIKTKKQIIKKFQTSYIPVLKSDIKISKTYKNELEKQTNDLLDPNRINHIMIDQIIPKQFLEMVPTSAEDFKIEIKNDKISFGGYTKQIIKDRDYLKLPMAVTVTLALEELTDSNLTSESSESTFHKLINFGMKEFKNFLGLINFINSGNHYSEQFDEEYISIGNTNDYFHIYFRNSGDPILFEPQNNPNLEIQYIQITSEDKSITGGEEVKLDTLKRSLSMSAPVIQQIQKEKEKDETQEEKEDVQFPSHSLSRSTFGRLTKNSNILNRDQMKSSEKLENILESFDNGITYEQDIQIQEPESKGNADTDYRDTDDEIPHIKRKLIDDDGLGPTQIDNKAKSIF